MDLQHTPPAFQPRLCIDSFTLELPASLGARKHSILRLLRAELSRRHWPAGQLAQLNLAPVTVSSQQTNLAIASHLATALADALNNATRQGASL